MPSMIDYRSDTVTKPTAVMKQAMVDAPLGDDVYGEDPTVIALEQQVAAQFGKAAGLFLPSGTQSNFVAMLSHCQRGEEVITAEQYHVFSYEARGASVLGGVSLHPLPSTLYGALTPDQIKAAIKEDDSHFPISRLVSLENTVSGCVQDQQNLDAITTLAHQHGLKTHLDGARIYNAVVASERSPAELTAQMDSVSVCLSKGLGTPAGSVLVGDEEFIRYARRQRKMLGGGMRQSGMLAAAGLYALEHNVARLADDHTNAKRLATALAEIPALNVDLGRVQTNMVFIAPKEDELTELASFMQQHDIILSRQRLVLHLDITAEMVERTISAFQAFYAKR
ncbi:low-specificity L-threonine aldolase [Leucothrix mucor]|uniref:low-specificity L-threonine aldolase n=1 Tax=Leucothrix mucor TaxID=45248 RepID=UPI0003B74FBE|nr:low-specificity L-threonine aldolase [Leucothrix mucor]